MGNLQCGQPLARECKGDTDIRYDPNGSDNLIDQNPFYSQYAGYWSPITYSYLSDVGGPNGGVPRQPELYNLTSGSGWPYTRDLFTGYQRITVNGSRYSSHTILFYPPAPMEFCSQNVPEGMTNVVGDSKSDPTNTTAVCGVNGNIVYIERFGVASYERDGRVNIIWSSMGPVYHGFNGPLRPGVQGYLEPVGGDAVFAYTTFDIPGRPMTFSDVETFLSGDFTNGFGTGSMAAGLPVNQGGTGVVRNTFLYSYSKAKDEADFMQQLRGAYADNNIVREEIPEWVVNGDNVLPTCLAVGFGGCPTEETYCGVNGTDPSCTRSPFQEPSPGMKPGAIAGFCILGLAIVAAVAYVLHVRSVKRQKKRLRKVFALQVAKRVDLRGSVSQLNPADLAAEFKRIDKGIKEDGSADGFISRDELWDFVSTGKAGEISEKDFNTLFDTMDAKGRGKVNFVEFCAFMSSCSEEVREVTQEEKKQGKRSNRGAEARLTKASLRLSSMNTQSHLP